RADLAQVDDFSRGGRRIAAAHDHDLARLVHDGGTLVLVAISEVRGSHRRPAASPPGVEIPRGASGAGVEDLAGGRQVHPRVEREAELGAVQGAPAGGGVPDLGYPVDLAPAA